MNDQLINILLGNRQICIDSNCPPISYSEYRAVENLFKQVLSSQKGFVSLYRYGSIKYPGISDLDLIIVLDDRGDYTRLRSKMELLLNEHDVKKIVIHKPLIVTPQIFRSISTFLFGSKIKLIAGVSLEIDPVPRQDLRLVQMMSIVDYIPFLLNNIRNMIRMCHLDLRRLLLLLNSVGHSVRLFVNLCGDLQVLPRDYILRIDELRNNALSNRVIKEALFSCSVAALDICFQLLKYMHQYALKSGLILKGIKDRVVYNLQGVGSISLFVDNFSRFNTSSAYYSFLANLEKKLITLKLRPHYSQIALYPSLWLYHYLMYDLWNVTNSNSVINFLRAIASSYFPQYGDVTMIKEYEIVINNKLQCSFDHISFVRKYELPSSMLLMNEWRSEFIDGIGVIKNLKSTIKWLAGLSNIIYIRKHLQG